MANIRKILWIRTSTFFSHKTDFFCQNFLGAFSHAEAEKTPNSMIITHTF
jgi:hypothetical protein